MKVRLEKEYILVISPNLVFLFGMISGTPKLARAAAFYPFIFARSLDVVEPWLVSHELIHFRQQIETLFIGSMLLDLVETTYAVCVLKMSFAESYKWRSSEQEAYRNQQNPDYLKTRKPWARSQYLKDKKMFEFGKPGEIVLWS